MLREKCQKGAAPAEQMMADVSRRYIKRISAGMYIVRMPFYLLYRLSHWGNPRIPLFLLYIAPTIQPCLNRFAVMERKLQSDIKVELLCKLLKLLELLWLLRLHPPLKLFTLLTVHCFHCSRCFTVWTAYPTFTAHIAFTAYTAYTAHTAYTAYIAYTAYTAFTVFTA